MGLWKVLTLGFISTSLLSPVVWCKKLSATKLAESETIIDDLDTVYIQLRTNLTKWEQENFGRVGAFSADVSNQGSNRDGLDSERKAAEPSLRTTGSETADVIVVNDNTINGYSTNCNNGAITGWTNLVDQYYSSTSTSDSTTAQINTGTGIFTAPAAGFYNICFSFRFLKGGDNTDITLRHSGTRVAAIGDALGDDWRSTGTCLIREMAANDQLQLFQETPSGNGNCIEETGWFYSRFSVYLIATNA